MNEREQFLKALEANEDDISVRMAFADFLDDSGEHEEADRQRKWPASKAWIIGFCEDNGEDEFGEIATLTYAEIMNRAMEAALGDGSFNCGNNMELSYSDHWPEFWKHWSIVTGLYMPPENVYEIRYSCAC